MSRQRHIKATPVKVFTEQGDIVEISAQFADSLIPDMRQQRGKQYVAFGDRNDYPTYLLWLYNKSAKHNAIINGKVVYIVGNGLETEDERGKEFLKKANEFQSWDDLIRLLSTDIENFGGFYLECIPKLGGGYNYYHVSFDKIRTNEENSKFFYKKEWANAWQTCDGEYPAFYNGIKETSIYQYKEYRCGKNPYPLPSWVAACNWIESDIEVSRHMLTNAKTGFSASKFINFYNGEPDETKKAKIQKRLENVATGAEGKKLLIAFNNSPDQRPTVDDLGASDLTKEDFTTPNNIITDNIITGHNITHPILFGVQQEGKLGSATELKTAFEIFKVTYANYKQKSLEGIVRKFSLVAGIDAEYKIKDVEPIGIELDPVQFKDMLPRAWVLEKLGIDEKKYIEVTVTTQQQQSAQGNAALVQLTGRQQQNLLRVVRLFSQGRLTKAQASIQLESFGFNADQINAYLGVDDDPLTNDGQFSNEFDDDTLANMFEEFAEDKANYTILSSVPLAYDTDKFMFRMLSELSSNELKIVELIKAQPEITNEQIAEALKLDVDYIREVEGRLMKDGIINSVSKAGVISRRIADKLPSKTLPDIQVMYTYEKRPDVSGATLIPTSRPFCVKMVNISNTRMFSRQNIQALSDRLGYSVFKRAGGFWNNNGTIEYHCRHEWVKHIVIKKS